eukprot:TRINITY_DN5368_c0_g1_i3.p1 TRINITY_DN5368_c0_g1~~TRINITY_DN5368_c0_g1_i3.p1  ORF type:complete len:196 (+),score=67.08 TRINITY_DN5368_c0_g1_i3:25-588(+)
MIRRPPRSTHCISSAASDVYKRQLFPKMMDILKQNKGKYFDEKSEEMKILNRMEHLLANYSGEVFADSKQALIYNTWYGEIADSLFTNSFKDDYERDSVIGSFFADHFYGNMIFKWAAGNDTSAPFCENAYNQQRSRKCVFNVVNGLVRAYRSIVRTLGRDEVIFVRGCRGTGSGDISTGCTSGTGP